MASPAPRNWLRTYWVPALVLLLWAACTAPRLTWPCKAGHESYITSLYGAFAHNHLKLGLSVTRGTNVLALDYSGQPIGYYSWSPLASWLYALPMAAGAPLQLSVRIITFLFFLWFLLAFWVFTRNVWGLAVANVALVVLAVLPVNVRYSLYAIQSLAPTLTVLALVASKRPRDRTWALGATVCGVVAALLFWFDWVLLLPALWWEARRGSRRLARPVAVWIVALPVAVLFGAMLVGEAGFGAVWAHLHERLTSGRMSTGDVPAGYLELLHRLAAFSLNSPAFFGAVAGTVAGLTLLWTLYRRLRRGAAPVPGDGWLWLLVAYGLPLTLLFRNLASYHDIFLQLYSPAVALCAGLAVTAVAARLDAKRGMVTALTAILLAALVGTATWPARYLWTPEPLDYQLRDVATTLGQMVGPDTVLLASPPMAGEDPRAPLDLASRQVRLPLPHVFCLTGKTAYVVSDQAELSVLLAQLGPGRDILVLDRHGLLEPLPPDAARQTFGPYTIARLPRPPGTATREGTEAPKGK